MALAVGKGVDYVRVQDESGAQLYLAQELAEKVLRPGYTVLAQMKGSDSAGKRYEPLYRFLPVDKEYAYVVAVDFVSTEDGTGIVHIAPAFGVDHMNVGREHNLPILHTVDAAGQFKPEAATPWGWRQHT